MLWVFAGPLIRHVFGDDYAAAVPWLGPLSLAMALYALTTVYVYHFLSLARTRFALVLVGVFIAQLAAFAVAARPPRRPDRRPDRRRVRVARRRGGLVPHPAPPVLTGSTPSGG